MYAMSTTRDGKSVGGERRLGDLKGGVREDRVSVVHPPVASAEGTANAKALRCMHGAEGMGVRATWLEH